MKYALQNSIKIFHFFFFINKRLLTADTNCINIFFETWHDLQNYTCSKDDRRHALPIFIIDFFWKISKNRNLKEFIRRRKGSSSAIDMQKFSKPSNINILIELNR